MEQTSQDNPLSHFSLGGIHGLPFQPWNDAGGEQQADPQSWGGYCTHGSMLFPTWHRPYVALYEVRTISYRLAHFTAILTK